MKLDIFNEIKKELERQERKTPWLAKATGKAERNMYGILNNRKDIYVGDLTDISVALKTNFFSKIIPLVDAAISAPDEDLAQPKNIDEETSTLHIGIKYSESQTEEIGPFLKQVRMIAKEYGFKIE